MSYVRISKPLGVSLYERACVAWEGMWAKKQLPKKPEEQDENFTSRHWTLCDDYATAVEAYKKGDAAKPGQFSVIMVDVKSGDPNQVCAPMPVKGGVWEPMQVGDRTFAYILPTSLIDRLTSTLDCRFSQYDARALVGVGKLHKKNPGAKKVRYSAMPKEYELRGAQEQKALEELAFAESYAA